MTRKLSVTESQKTAQFFGTSVRRKCRTDRTLGSKVRDLHPLARARLVGENLELE